MRRCHFCGKPLAREPYFQQITGWVASEKRDSLTLRSDIKPPRYSCRRCIRNQQLGIIQEQGSLV